MYFVFVKKRKEKEIEKKVLHFTKGTTLAAKLNSLRNFNCDLYCYQLLTLKCFVSVLWQTLLGERKMYWSLIETLFSPNSYKQLSEATVEPLW